MKFSICAISDPTRMLEIKGDLDAFINRWSENPFFLSAFTEQFMKSNSSKGLTPLVLVIEVDNKIVGVALLRVMKRFGIRFARFLSNIFFSPDFIVDGQYREACIVCILDFLFKTLRCRFVVLDLPAESPNLRILERKYKANRIRFRTMMVTGHRVLPVECTWDEFQKLRGGNFRWRFKRIERNLNRVGPLRIVWVENASNGSDVFKKILNVERMSWKEDFRTRRHVTMDEDLLMVWEGSQLAGRTEPGFSWAVCFIELNYQIIAYALILQYKETAFMVKSSYDNRYRRFSPGMYVLNAAIRELFSKSQVNNIDFLTDLPFIEAWTSTCLPRIKILMWKWALPTLMGFSYARIWNVLKSLARI